MKTRVLNCADVASRIESYRRGRMSLADARAMFEHLMTCAACHARFWRPWYRTGGAPPRTGEGEDEKPAGHASHTVTVSGNWTVETTYKLVADDAGTVARAYGLGTIAGSTQLVKARAGREDCTLEPSRPQARPGVSFEGRRARTTPATPLAGRMLSALDALGLAPPWRIQTCVEFKPRSMSRNRPPPDIGQDADLPIAIAAASCVLEMPVPADTIFTGAVNPDGTLSPATTSPKAPPLPGDMRVVCPAGDSSIPAKARATLYRCRTLAEALDHAGTVPPPEDGPVWCTSTLEPGRAFPPADESVQGHAVTMVRLLATLPSSLVIIELDGKAAKGTWWLVIGGRVGLAAVGGPGTSQGTGKDLLCPPPPPEVEGAARLWEAIRGRLLDAGTVTSPGVDLWIERFVEFADRSPHRFCASVDRWPTDDPGDEPALPWLLQQLRRAEDPLPYLPFPMAIELAKGLNEVHPDWFPPPVVEELGPDTPLAGHAPGGADLPFMLSTSPPATTRGQSRETGATTTDGASRPPKPAPAPGNSNDSTGGGPRRQISPPPRPAVSPPMLHHLGVALPHVPLPRYLQGYHLELGEDGTIGPDTEVAVARLHVATKRAGSRRHTTLRLEAEAPGITVDNAPIEAGGIVSLSGYHVIRYPGVQFRIEPARRDTGGKRPCIAFVMVPGGRYPLREGEIRIGRNPRRCDIVLPDRRTIENLVWTEEALRLDTIIVGRHRLKRAHCYLDGFEVGSEHATLTTTQEGVFVRALRPFPVYVLAVPPFPIEAVGKQPVRIRHQDRLLIGHDLFQLLLE